MARAGVTLVDGCKMLCDVSIKNIDYKSGEGKQALRIRLQVYYNYPRDLHKPSFE